MFIWLRKPLSFFQSSDNVGSDSFRLFLNVSMGAEELRTTHLASFLTSPLFVFVISVNFSFACNTICESLLLLEEINTFDILMEIIDCLKYS